MRIKSANYRLYTYNHFRITQIERVTDIDATYDIQMLFEKKEIWLQYIEKISIGFRLDN